MRAAAVAVLLAGIACARDGNAQGSSAKTVVPDDTAAVARLLSAVRGSDPLLCELATRSVDMQGWWSRWGSISGNPLERDSASASIIGWIQHDHTDPAVVPRLRAALRDPDGCVRRVAGSFLGRVQHPTAITALVGGLEDAGADTRFVSAIGLGLSEEAAATQPLIRALRDDDAMVRRAAAWALGSLEALAAQDALLTALERDRDPRVRQAAAWAIGRLHD